MFKQKPGPSAIANPSKSQRSWPDLLLSSLILALLLCCASCSRETPEQKQTRLIAEAKTYIEEDKLEEARISLLAAADAKPDNAEVYFELAEVMFRLNKFSEAVENYRAVLNLDPTHRKARLHLAAIMLAARQYELAENHALKLLEKDPNDLEALVLRANLERTRGQLNVAQKTIEKVIGFDSQNVAAHGLLADIELSRGNTAKAEALLHLVLEFAPQSRPIRLALADLYVRQNRLDDAEELIGDMLEQSPKNTSLRFYFGEFLLARGLGDKALNQYRTTIETDPEKHFARDRLYDMYLTRGMAEDAKRLTDELEKASKDSPGIYYFKARNLLLEGKKEEALGLFIKAIERMPKFAPAFRRAGLVELSLGRKTEGLEHLNQTIAIDESDIGARLALGRYFFSQKDFSQAMSQAEKVLSRFPRQLGANVLRADVLTQRGETALARKVYQILIASFPNSPLGYYKMALLEETEKNDEAAIGWWTRGLTFDQDVLLPAKRLAALLAKRDGVEGAISKIVALKRKSSKTKAEFSVVESSLLLRRKPASPSNIDGARRLLKQALEEKPQLLPAYWMLARLDSRDGDHETAARNYEKLVAASPRHLPSRMLLALTYEKLKNTEKAAEEYQKILEQNSRFGPAANNLAWILVEKEGGDLAKALELALIAKEELPRESSVADTLGWIYFRRSSHRAALQILEEAVELEEKNKGRAAADPEILYHLALVKEALNDKVAARKLIEEILKRRARLPQSLLAKVESTYKNLK